MKYAKPLLWALLCSSSAFGQTVLPEKEDTIIIAARGRSENSLKVPIAVSVITDALTTRKLDSLETLLSAAPGVYFISDTDPGTNLISIRGVSTNRGQAPSVSIVTDGRVVPDSELYTFKPFDVAQVEILKGPQGALYGRAAAGGVIAIRHIQPGDIADNYARIGLGNGAAKTFAAALTAPISEKIALRVATTLADDRGFIQNNTLRKKTDAFQSLNFRGILSADLSDALKASVQLNYAHEQGGAAFVSSNNITGRFGGRLSGAALTNPIGDFEGRSDRDWFGALATLKFTLANGDALTSLTAYDDYKKNFIEELDFRPDKNLTFFGFPAFPNGIQPISQPVKISAVTQELRYTSRDDAPVRFIAGGFLQIVNKRRTDDFVGFGSFAAEQNKTTALGFFAQGAVDISETFEASAALRYDREKRTQYVRNRANALLSTRAAAFDTVQPKITLSYKPSADILVYVSASTGFKPGGFNPTSSLAPSTPILFASEKTLSGEIGLKAKMGAARFEVAGYATRHSNFQNTVFLDNNLVFSIPRVNIIGIEASSDIDLGNGFKLDGAVSWTRARLGDYAVANPTIEVIEPVAKCRFAGNTLCQFGGNSIPNSPDYTAHIGGQWQGTIGAQSVTARLDYSRTGKIFYETDNVLVSPDFASVDARFAIKFGSVEAALWGKNLANSRRALAAFGQQNLLLLSALGPNGPFDSFTINKGRTWGGTLSITF